MPQNRPQAARKGQPLFLIYRNLGDAANLVFDRVFNGDDLVFIRFDFRQRRVERGGLTAAGRSRHQHHSVGLADKAAQSPDLAVRKAQNIQAKLAKLFVQRFLVKNTQYSVLAMDGRHDGHAEINRAPAVADPEAAILRHAPFSNIEVCHHLDAADHVRLMLVGKRVHGLLEGAVDAVLHHHRIVTALEMDVTGAPFQPREDNRIHQPDDWADVVLADQLLKRKIFVPILFLADNVQAKLDGGLVQY